MKIIFEKCKKCLNCINVCPVSAISNCDNKVQIDKNICIECGCCAASCPNNAIDFE